MRDEQRWQGQPRYQPLVVLCGSLAAGIVVDRCAPQPLWVWCAVAVVALSGWAVVWLRGRPRLAAGALLLAVAATGAAWHHDRWCLYAVDDVGRGATADAAPVCVEAIAQTSPRVQQAPPPDPMRTIPQSDRSTLTVRVTRVRDGRRWRPATGAASLTVRGHLLGVRAGDRLRIFAALLAVVPPENPGQFDYAASQRSQRRLCRLHANYPECVVLVERAASAGVTAGISRLRDHGDRLLWRHVRHRSAGLATAVLLGVREQVDRQRTEDFFTTGTVHLLAISGLHVGILAYGFWLLAGLVPCSRRGTLLAIVTLVVLYALLTSARPPVVRAAVIVGVVCSARLVGREALGFNTLALAGIIVLAINPTQVFATGTQLSFLAVATLSGLPAWLWSGASAQDPLDRLIAQSRPWPWRVARRVFSAAGRLWLASAAVWIVALPLVMYRFHLVSPVALILNPIVWLPMALALFSGFGVLIFGWLAPPLATFCGWLCDANLTLIDGCVGQGLRWAGSHGWVPAPPAWWVIGFYVAVAALLAAGRERVPRRWCAALAAGWFALGFAVMLGPSWRWPGSPPVLTCTFISVGHGSSVLVELPDGRNLLYDAGRMGDPRAGVRPIAAVLWSRRVTHLDAVVISHADADHYNALPALLERFSVGAVYVSPVMFRQRTASLTALQAAIRAAGVPLRTLAAGDRLRVGRGAELQVLHPAPAGVAGSDNANSIVLRMDFAGRTILLPGDLEPPGLEELLATPPVACDLVMAPHHGSPNSNPRGFAAWSTPRWVVISGGRERDLATRQQAYRAGGAQVLHTAYDGAVSVRVTVERFEVRAWTSRGAAGE